VLEMMPMVLCMTPPPKPNIAKCVKMLWKTDSKDDEMHFECPPDRVGTMAYLLIIPKTL